MSSVDRMMKKDPEFERQVKFQVRILKVCEVMMDQGYHVSRRQKMEEYLDLLDGELGFNVKITKRRTHRKGTRGTKNAGN
jgi:hypothetical protein